MKLPILNFSENDTKTNIVIKVKGVKCDIYLCFTPNSDCNFTLTLRKNLCRLCQVFRIRIYGRTKEQKLCFILSESNKLKIYL
jgi:hypothetical protein